MLKEGTGIIATQAACESVSHISKQMRLIYGLPVKNMNRPSHNY